MPTGLRSSRTGYRNFPIRESPRASSSRPPTSTTPRRFGLLGPARGIGLRPPQRRTVSRLGRSGDRPDPRSQAAHPEEQSADAWTIRTAPVEKIGAAYGPEDVAGDTVWRFAGSEFRTEGNQAVLEWKGRYGNDFDGGFEIRMDDAGDAEFRYEFAYKGPDLWAREIGLEFELPLDFDKLSWDRNAEYSYYPDDHIGRPQGEAVAHPAVPQSRSRRRPALRAGRSCIGLQRFPQHETAHLYRPSHEQRRPRRGGFFRRLAARPRDRWARTTSA